MGSTPSAPDPTMSSMIQQQANNNAAQQQQKMNMVGQNTPYGSLSWTPDGNAPGGYTATQSLNPQFQHLLDTNTSFSQGISDAANGFAGNNAANISAQSPQYSPYNVNIRDNTPNLSLQNNNPNLDLSYNADAQRLSDLNKSTLDPYWSQQENDFDQKMADDGLVPGGNQYDNAYRDFNVAKSNAYDQANLNAYNTVNNNAATQFGANNSVVNQNNQNAQNMFSQNNAVVNQNNQNELNRQNSGIQNLTAGLAAYNNPFNVISALQSGGQVAQAPSLGLTQTPQESIQAPDYSGMASNNYSTQMAQSNAMMGGLFGLGGKLLGGFGMGAG